MTDLLLDSSILIRAAIDPSRLSREARDILEGSVDNFFFSVVSIWEIAIKASLGRSDFDVDALHLRDGLLARHFREVPIRSVEAVAAAQLPAIHRDPFDRLLVAQAQVLNVTLLTNDATIARYPGPIRLV